MCSVLEILFIDEQNENFEFFANYVDASSLVAKVNLECVLPSRDIKEMIDLIIEKKPKALIVDHLLNEIRAYADYPIGYNGTDLVHEFLKIKPGFPCFVLTAHDENAETNSNDVNIVYSKRCIHRDDDGAYDESFLQRIVKQIEKYENKLRNAENDLEKLLELRRTGKANYQDELKIIELDTFLEQSIDGRAPIPEEFKTTSNVDRLEKLIKKVDDLLKKEQGDK